MKISETLTIGRLNEIIEKSFVSCKIYGESLKRIARIIYNNVIL